MESIDDTLVTGGAGFIGSHLTDQLMQKRRRVTIVDNLSTGRIDNIKNLLNNSNVIFEKADLKNSKVIESLLQESKLIFHLAANSEVRAGEMDPKIHFEENLEATFNLLESMRKSRYAKTIVFASTSTVYGEPSIIPTPEDYGPLVPISTYGATKLGCEALITSYAHTFNLRALIIRLANIVGPRASHGVVPDFIAKLKLNPRKLEILGDGNQKKSYLHIDDCIEAILHTANRFIKSNNRVDIYNVGSTNQITVRRIAEIVTQEMNLQDVNFIFTGGVNRGRGWKGDVKTMRLSLEKINGIGWKPKHESEQAIKLAVRAQKRENCEMVDRNCD